MRYLTGCARLLFFMWRGAGWLDMLHMAVCSHPAVMGMIVIIVMEITGRITDRITGETCGADFVLLVLG